MIKHALKHSQQGLTIIEVMISVVLSLLLILGTVEIFTSNKQSYRVVEASSRVQESGRFAFHFLSSPVRMAGFTGCSNIQTGGSFTVTADKTKYGGQIQAAIDAFGSGQSIRGYTVVNGAVPADIVSFGLTSGAGVGQIPTTGTSEVLVITRGGACDGGQIVPPYMGDKSANIKIKDAASCGISQNSLVIISNCSKTDLFAVTNNPLSGATKDTLSHSNSQNVGNLLSEKYGPDASVYGMNVDVYYVGNGSNGEPSLFRRVLVAGVYQNQELVPGIASITALFGVDIDAAKDGMADTYINSATVTATTNWGNIVSVRLSLGAQSAENNIINGAKLVHTFTSTIKIRNTR